jgi:hypothetical protein
MLAIARGLKTGVQLRQTPLQRARRRTGGPMW